ncbi:putative spermidine/putrescine transport system ATP-binding protein [Rhodoligotrophos appendicifer]|uniref:ABC transporter ATP-binding protein n=1 Tax=Rhodoligotrophos appendicifer TaxID=987056 RepID=UPI0011856CB8|nr:ABC transporter ATP-binding protein [Rhodoligotrophos appendicifer]
MTASSLKALPVAISNLSKHYGSVTALDQVTLSVKPGEFVTLLGPSGSGKTTLLMAIAGFTSPDAGSIAIDGQEIVRLPPHKRNIGMVFQNYALFPHMSVGDNVAYPLRLRGVSKAEASARVGQALGLVQLSGYESRRVDQLSGGQRQRIALARAIVFEPRILLMDEPLSALDKQLREHMQIEIRKLHNQLGMTTIAVTHDQREALTMSDRVAVLQDGRLMQYDTPRDIYENPRNRFVAEFIGESSFLPVELQGGNASFAGRGLKLAAPPSATARNLRLLMRPEKLEFANGVDRPEMNRFEGTLVDAVFQGESILATVRLPGDHDVFARIPNRQLGSHGMPEIGSRVAIAMHAQDTRLVPDS